MLADAEIASMVNERADYSVDKEILRPTQPQLKSAIQLIQSHLLQSDSGDKHLPKLNDIAKSGEEEREQDDRIVYAIAGVANSCFRRSGGPGRRCTGIKTAHTVILSAQKTKAEYLST